MKNSIKLVKFRQLLKVTGFNDGLKIFDRKITKKREIGEKQSRELKEDI